MSVTLKVILIILDIFFLIFLYALNVEEKPKARRLVANLNIFLCALILIASIVCIGLMVKKNNMSLCFLLIPASILSIYVLIHAYRVM